MNHPKIPTLSSPPEQPDPLGPKSGLGLDPIEVDVEMPNVQEPRETGTAASDDPLGIKEVEDD